MSEKKKILIQLDSDPMPSVFDRIVAVDAGAEEVFSYGGVTEEGVRELVHGAIFTRGPKDLHRTALFIGGKDIAEGERILGAARKSFFGPFQVSVMLDSSGANTTAAAAVAAVAQHLELRGAVVLVLGGTGSVGRRVARLLLRQGAQVRLGSRHLERARAACAELSQVLGQGLPLEPALAPPGSGKALAAALDGAAAVVASGGPGACLLPAAARRGASALRLAVDLNAVPPAGIEGVEAVDRAVERDSVLCYGAVGVGGLKMRIHKAAVASLFERSDQVLDSDGIFDLGRKLPST